MLIFGVSTSLGAVYHHDVVESSGSHWKSKLGREIEMRLFGGLFLIGCLSGEATADVDSAESEMLRVALIADSHIIDSYYTCCEGSTLDTESLQFASDRLIEVRSQLNALEPQPDALGVCTAGKGTCEH